MTFSHLLGALSRMENPTQPPVKPFCVFCIIIFYSFQLDIVCVPLSLAYICRKLKNIYQRRNLYTGGSLSSQGPSAKLGNQHMIEHFTRK